MTYSTRDIPTFTYDELDSFLGGKQEKKICNLTYASRESYWNPSTGQIVIQHESGITGSRNTIAVYKIDGRTMYTDACWQTVPTKQRLNQLLPNGGIYQQDFTWHFESGAITIQLNEGSYINFKNGQFVDVTNN